jgi:uncharacterized membrane protein
MIHLIASLAVVGNSNMFRLSDSRLDVLHRLADMGDLGECWQRGLVSFHLSGAILPAPAPSVI